MHFPFYLLRTSLVLHIATHFPCHPLSPFPPSSSQCVFAHFSYLFIMFLHDSVPISPILTRFLSCSFILSYIHFFLLCSSILSHSLPVHLIFSPQSFSLPFCPFFFHSLSLILSQTLSFSQTLNLSQSFYQSLSISLSLSPVSCSLSQALSFCLGHSQFLNSYIFLSFFRLLLIFLIIFIFQSLLFLLILSFSQSPGLPRFLSDCLSFSPSLSLILIRSHSVSFALIFHLYLHLCNRT